MCQSVTTIASLYVIYGNDKRSQYACQQQIQEANVVYHFVAPAPAKVATVIENRTEIKLVSTVQLVR